ncbi:MAG: SMC-Scp complex subunit ScpB [Coxiellaceae bacterium]|nr:SMC-Scp complex subunit ScpB [Coxiellaceae bacterium]
MSNTMTQQQCILEAALFASAVPLTIDKLRNLFSEETCPTAAEIKADLQTIATSYDGRGVELVEVATGYRFQANQQWSPWLSRLWEKKPPRYSRALLETLALIIYRQPITRAEIEDVRGVVVSSNIIRTLLDRDWIKEAGYRDTPGKPALFATTKQFLDDFNVTALSELPTLKETMDLEEVEQVLSEQLHLSMDTNQAIQKALQSSEEITVNDDHAEQVSSVVSSEEGLSSDQPIVIIPAVSDEEIAAVLAEADEKLEAIDAARSSWTASDDDTVDDELNDEPIKPVDSCEHPIEQVEAVSECVEQPVEAVAKAPVELV